MTGSGAGAPSDWIEGCLAAQSALGQTLDALLDAEVARRPSRLPGWTVGHVLTHLARNADSLVWRLEGAAVGEQRDQYPGGLEQRRADIEAGAGRPAAELRQDVSRTSAAVAGVLATLPLPAWDALSRSSRGILEDSRQALFSRWREVVVHHGDLGLVDVPLPEALVEAWLPRELPHLSERTEPAHLLAWVIGRADAPTLGPW